jgi:hypothetical protein
LLCIGQGEDFRIIELSTVLTLGNLCRGVLIWDDGFGDRNVPRVPDGYQEHHDGFGGWLMAVRAMVLLVWKVEQWLSRKRYVVNGGKSMKRVLLCMILIGSIFQVSAQDQGGITGRLV